MAAVRLMTEAEGGILNALAIVGNAKWIGPDDAEKALLDSMTARGLVYESRGYYRGNWQHPQVKRWLRSVIGY